MKSTFASIGGALALAALLLAGCGGGGGGVPPGSSVNYSPSPSSSASFTPSQINVVVVRANAAQSVRKRPAYFSAATQSVTLQLVAVNGQSVPSQPPTTIDTFAGAPNCTTSGTLLNCSGTVDGAISSSAVFSVTTYAQPNGTGAVLSAGSFAANTQSTGTLTLDSSDSGALNSVVSAVSLAAVPATLPDARASSTTLVVTAYDATGAVIVGPGTFVAPIVLSVPADATHAFSFAAIPASGTPPPGTSTYSLNAPGSNVALEYNGDPSVGGTTVLVQAQWQGSAAQSTTTTTLTIAPSPTPKPTATPKATPTPSPTSAPSAYLYVLDQGATGTVREYNPTANGNVAPDRTFTLPVLNGSFAPLAPVSLAVDASGNVYVGFDAGYPDPSNEIDVFAPGASGNAAPVRRIRAENGGNNTLLDPQFIAVDPSGRIATLVQTSLDSQNAAAESVGIYAASASGSIAPLHAWNFDGTQGATFQPGVVMLGSAFDANGALYVAGQLLDANASPVYGIFVAPPSASGGGNVRMTREIPADATTNFQVVPGGLALDATGTIFASDTSNGVANVFTSGYNGGLTDVPPARTIVNTGFLTGLNAPLAIVGSTLFAVNQASPSIFSLGSGAQGPTSAATTISGSKTGLSSPVWIVSGPSISGRTAGK